MATPPGSGSGSGSASPGLDSFPQVAIEMTSTPSTANPVRERRFSNASSIPRRLSKSFQEAELPTGFLGATADMTSSVFVAGRTRSSSGRTRSSTGGRTRSSVSSANDDRTRPFTQQRLGAIRTEDTTLAILEEPQRMSVSFDQARSRGEGEKSIAKSDEPTIVATSESHDACSGPDDGTDVRLGAKMPAANADAAEGREYDNGYHFPPQYSKSDNFRHAAIAFGKYIRTPVGFLVLIYGLNVVAWGAMLFFLLLDASPAMCHPSCGNINSPRRIWVEIDSQILNSLFCVTGFGMAPWRLRDLFFLLRFRLAKNLLSLRRLAGVHRGWIRLPGSENLPLDVGPTNIPDDTPRSVLPFPESKIPDVPLTGERAPPTALWRVDFVLWMNAGNTFLQCVLSGFMWGMTRHNRPSWATGLFVALGCISGAVGGLGMFYEGKRVKGIEGVPLTHEDYEKLAQDRALGISHYNNLDGKKPKEKVIDLEAVKEPVK
ncbi:hypothetical protein CMQ_7596 [Grosmannia clavigera kw1407]|uniref:Alpha-l-rhamnosidase c n=1 Tax=Grosmannia clavigera (strain kw1407 / UAMH 11150) TaxID=655863 RepID=F0XQJ8_GROCL|nr:uncharacterized protein CMQ_7596 [Grosmannia clavigera kw1407]EFX00594.1 hypothetical protein CMQ_7596 [Grosmannia clavigera kw1407]